MKLKYYLRGLGIGIAITTLILAISYNINGRMSDSEIIRRAKELGMVMATEESDDLFNKPAGEDTTTKSPDETDDASEETTPEETTPEVTEPEENESNTSEEPTTTEPATTEPTTTEPTTTEPVITYTFYVEKGTSSQAVSKLLVEGGIITDAKDFNNYMVRAGYTGIIQRGTYTLDSSMSYEEIAKALIRMEENT